MSTQQSFMPNDVERTRSKRRMGKKTVVVQYRAKASRSSIWFKDWTTFRRYADHATAERVLRVKSGDVYFEYRIQP